MLSLVGNIKINDSLRLKYLKATLWSFEFIKDFQLLLNIECDCKTLDEITDEVNKIGFTNFELSNKSGNYGKIYYELLEKVSSEFVLNIIEDHFCLLDSRNKLMVILKAMKTERVDICKASFWQIEKNSSKEILGHYDINYGLVYDNNKTNHNLYQKYYGSRYYIGVNFITTLEFAKLFWNRSIETNTPHRFEIPKYDINFHHIAMIPSIEILASIDDSHGEKNTCLLESNETKFVDIYNKLYAI